MHIFLLIFGIILAVNHVTGTQQIQMPESASFMTDEDLVDQLDRMKHNITDLWTNFNELKTVLTQTLNHLRVHQAELEETVHMLGHKHDGAGGAPGAYTDDHHHHSGEQHTADSHSHGSDDHHHHSGEQHSHGNDHSHSGESHSHSGDTHSHGGDSHSHGGDSHSHDDSHHGGDDHHHSGEQHSHGGDYHSSYSHSHSHSGHEMDSQLLHGNAHESADNVQQTQQGTDSILEPIIQPTNVQHHHQQPHMAPPSSSMQLISDNYFNSHHHHHHTHSRSQRNRTVEIPKFSEYALYDFAVCNVQPNRAIPEDQQQEIMGRINLWQKKSGGPLNIHVRLQGFDMGDHHQHHDAQQSLQKEEDNETPVTSGSHKHGFHIHTLGDLSNGCQSTGPHYNPKNVNHGGPNALIRHVGDLGNIECDDHGNTNIVFNDEIASLKGPYSIIGKSINIHTTIDDFGLGGDEESLKTGNAGTRLACCVIEKVEKLPIRSYKYIKAATLHQN